MRANGGHLVALAVAVELARAKRTASWLSERSGIEMPHLQARFRGEEEFTVVDLANIAAALGIPVATLVPGSTEGESLSE